ncbi:hypothetical protein [Actinopolymorpha sp. B9G3]|uniref:hypothetical protein n=1 Tax=Actinopolymorpha sp. B9G3 TaxID=3158970 RepID=UPI0032D8FF56
MSDDTWAPPGWQGEVGVGRRDITPPAGIRAKNWGAALTDVSTGAHRPLTLTAVALRAGPDAEPVVLITADLSVWRRAEDEWFVRGAVLQAHGLDATRVMLHLVHTHASPSIHASEVDQPGGAGVPAYLATLRDAAVAATGEALATCVPASMTVATGRSSVAAIRDLPAGDRYVVGFNPQARADDTLMVARIAAAGDGRVLATIVNYACHPTTLAWENTLVSADYVGGLRAIVEAGTEGAPCVFLQGASGDLAPREQYTGDTSVADRHGFALGHAALGALQTLPPPAHGLALERIVESGAPLAVWRPRAATWSRDIVADRTELSVPVKPLPTFEELERRWAGIDAHARAERIHRAMDQRDNLPTGTTTTQPVWTWRLGDVVMVAQPGEAYSVFQRTLRDQVPEAAVFVLNLTNGHSLGYLPPLDAYDHDIYQVWQTAYGAGTLEQVTSHALSRAKGLLSTR